MSALKNTLVKGLTAGTTAKATVMVNESIRFDHSNHTTSQSDISILPISIIIGLMHSNNSTIVSTHYVLEDEL